MLAIRHAMAGAESMPMTRRHLTAVAAALTLLSALGSAPAESQTYPSKPITIVVAFPAGGFADIFARLLGSRLTERLGATVVIENRGGGGGNIAAATVANAAPDGHTLLVTTNAVAINETLTKNRGFTVDDLKAVAIPAWAPDTLVVNAKHPAKTLAEFIAGAKGKSISFGTPGVGTTGHIVATNLFKQLTTIESVHVPFQGGAPLVNALVGGHIDVAAGAVVGFASQLQSGAIRPIVVATEKRLAQFADVPTYVESGFPGLVVENWVGVFAPGKTPEPIAVRLNEAVDAIMREPEVQARLAPLQMQTRHGDRPRTEAYFKDEVARWAKMAQAIGLGEQ
jgi:tripartite-type tricarboxylate transporter receptor subunit TctC